MCCIGILKQIRLRESKEKKKTGGRSGGGGGLACSRTSLSLNIAKEILQKMCIIDNKSKSCENLHVL
jgi:Rad/Gem-related GTP binding protein 1